MTQTQRDDFRVTIEGRDRGVLDVMCCDDGDVMLNISGYLSQCIYLAPSEVEKLIDALIALQPELKVLCVVAPVDNPYFDY